MVDWVGGLLGRGFIGDVIDLGGGLIGSWSIVKNWGGGSLGSWSIWEVIIYMWLYWGCGILASWPAINPIIRYCWSKWSLYRITT